MGARLRSCGDFGAGGVSISSAAVGAPGAEPWPSLEDRHAVTPERIRRVAERRGLRGYRRRTSVGARSLSGADTIQMRRTRSPVTSRQMAVSP